MPRPKIGTSYTEPVETSFDLLAELGAVELQVFPDHWGAPLPEGKEYAIYVEGRNLDRPDWSRREAGRLAQTCLQYRAWLQRHLDRAVELGVARPVSVPRWHGVALCPHCHELQITRSGASDKMQECWNCKGQCHQKHQSGARTCEQCRSIVKVIWTSDDDLPGEWYQ